MINDTTVKCFHYEGYDQPRQYLANPGGACNFARHLKTYVVSPPTKQSAKPRQTSHPGSLKTSSVTSGTKRLAFAPTPNKPKAR